jgi:IS30 family transposase
VPGLYFPKKTSFDTISKVEIKRAREKLNTRPGKRFKFKSPMEKFNPLMKIVIAT